MIEKTETPHLELRKALERDLETVWHNVWQDRELAKNMLWKPTETLEDATARLKRTIEFQKDHMAYFVCLKETDEPIGFAGMAEPAPGEFEETGICIARAYQGRGFGKEVLKALLEMSFEKLGGKSFLYACFRENERSAALCKSCGFKYSHSENCVREWDGYEYICDFYRLYK